MMSSTAKCQLIKLCYEEFDDVRKLRYFVKHLDAANFNYCDLQTKYSLTAWKLLLDSVIFHNNVRYLSES